MSSFCKDYDFELENIASRIAALNIKRVLIQLPEGLQRCIPEIVSRLRELINRNLEIIVSLNPSFGACLVDEGAAKEVGAELILHFGHLEYPLYRPRLATLFIPVEYKASELDRLLDLLKPLCSNASSRLCLATTAQHIELVKELVARLANSCNIEFRGVVLGCIPIDPRECDKVIVIAGGSFHCIAQALYTPNKEVLCLDPYTYRLWNPRKDVNRILRVRYWKIMRARNARRWLIIDGFYGQSRPNIIRNLVEMLQKKGYSYTIAKVLRLDEAVLRNLGAEQYDAIVVVSCPRIAIDDLTHFEVPVLTPGEAIMILGEELEVYRYPW